MASPKRRGGQLLGIRRFSSCAIGAENQSV